MSYLGVIEILLPKIAVEVIKLKLLTDRKLKLMVLDKVSNLIFSFILTCFGLALLFEYFSYALLLQADKHSELSWKKLQQLVRFWIDFASTDESLKNSETLRSILNLNS